MNINVSLLPKRYYDRMKEAGSPLFEVVFSINMDFLREVDRKVIVNHHVKIAMQQFFQGGTWPRYIMPIPVERRHDPAKVRIIGLKNPGFDTAPDIDAFSTLLFNAYRMSEDGTEVDDVIEYRGRAEWEKSST